MSFSAIQFIIYLSLFTLLLFFVILSIKKDHLRGLKKTKKILLEPYNIQVPPWWGISQTKKNQISFKRFDTFYEWEATYQIYPALQAPACPEKLLQNESITLDKGADIMKGKDWFQIEGKGTKKGEKRIFIQAFVKKGHKGDLSAISLSSVLNGMVEGPYFENSIKGLKNLKN